MNTINRLIGYRTAKGIRRAYVLNQSSNRHTIKDDATQSLKIITDARIVWINS